MTPDQRRELNALLADFGAAYSERHMMKVVQMRESIHTYLDRVEELNAPQKPATNPYYDFLNRFDEASRALKLCEGRVPDQKAAIDHLISTLSAYAESLERLK